MEIVQPIYSDEYGTHRFLRNEIICNLFVENRKLHDVAILYYESVPTIHIDHYRQFNQLIGYSVSGYSSLSCCYIDKENDDYDDEYIDYISSLKLQENPKHPETKILDKYQRFKSNEIIKKCVDMWNYDVESILHDDSYSIEDRKQFAELLGFSVDEVKRRFKNN